MPDSDVSLLEPNPGGVATLFGLAQATIQNAKTAISVAMPGTVVAYLPPVSAGPESKPARVTVRPGFKYARKINRVEDMNPGEVLDTSSKRSLFAVGELPVIPSAVVLYPGPKGMQNRGVLEPGEGGLLVVADKSLDEWIQTGGPVDPGVSHRHKFADSVFVPGLRHGLTATPVSPDVWLCGHEDGGAGMTIDKLTRDLTLFTEGVAGVGTALLDAPTLIKLGIAAALGVARLTDPVAAGPSMATWIGSVQAALTVIAAVIPGITLPVPPVDFGIISGASTKVLAE